MSIGATSMAIDDLVYQIKQLENCEVYPTAGLPFTDLALPPDLEEFYQLCGGATLFKAAEYSIEIVKPIDFVRANPVIAGVDGADDISYEWFVVARADEQYITIDLNVARQGRCYDSFWDCHALPGDCQIVSLSFEALLENLIKGHGTYWFWLQEDFEDLGDAYDM